MVTTELAPPEPPAVRPRTHQLRTAAACTAALIAVTLLAAGAGAIDPGLAPATRPHPTLHPTAGAVLSILLTNTRVLALPFLLILFRFTDTRPTRIAGTALLAGILAGNAISVGLALGRWQKQLLPYLPHLPLEWAAAGLAASTWAGASTHRRDTTAVILTALAVGGLLTAAAVVEVLLTPHAPRR